MKRSTHHLTMTSEHPAAAQLKQSSEGHPCFHTPHHRRKEKNIFDYIIWHTTSQLTQKQMTTHLIGDVVVMLRWCSVSPPYLFVLLHGSIWGKLIIWWMRLRGDDGDNWKAVSNLWALRRVIWARHASFLPHGGGGILSNNIMFFWIICFVRLIRE